MNKKLYKIIISLSNLDNKLYMSIMTKYKNSLKKHFIIINKK